MSESPNDVVTQNAATTVDPNVADADGSFEQCRAEQIADLPTGKRVLKAADLWKKGREALKEGKEECVDLFGRAIYLDILGASFFLDLIPPVEPKDGEPAPPERPQAALLKKFLSDAINKEYASPADKMPALLANAYTSFLLTCTPTMRIMDPKEGAEIVRDLADQVVACDPSDPRLRIIRAGFLSQLGGQAGAIGGGGKFEAECIEDAEKALELVAEKLKTASTEEEKAWLRLQEAHAHLQLGDVSFGPRADAERRTKCVHHLKKYLELSTECDPDHHSVLYKMSIMSMREIDNPDNVMIVPDLVRQKPAALAPAVSYYRRAVKAQLLHHRWLPRGMDENSGPMARVFMKLAAVALRGQKINFLEPPPGARCENPACSKSKELAPKNAPRCKRCHWSYFCQKECIAAGWKSHKAVCGELSTFRGITADGAILAPQSPNPEFVRTVEIAKRRVRQLEEEARVSRLRGAQQES